MEDSSSHQHDRTSLQDHIRRYVEGEICRGQFAPGSAIDERALAGAFKSSRTPVREALLILSMQGLVEIRPRSGIYVRRPGAAELVALFEALTEIEAVVASLAAQRADKAGHAALNQALEACGRMAKKSDPQSYAKANDAFHAALYRYSANPIIVDQVRSIRARLAAFRLRVFDRPGRLLASYGEHRQVVERILAGDAEGAARAMRYHISSGGKGFADLVLSSGGKTERAVR